MHSGEGGRSGCIQGDGKRLWRAQRCEMQAGELGGSRSMQDLVEHVREFDFNQTCTRNH